eukprot:g31450.t1
MGQAFGHLFGSEPVHEEVDGMADDPGGTIPGVDITGDSCSCTYPPISKETLHKGDEERLLREFAISMDRFGIAKQHLSDALETMRTKYTDLALARRDLESSQMGAAWEHFSKCRPLSKKYGLYLPCHENFKTAMRRYRGLLQKPSCPVGASLPLRPASAPLIFPPPVPDVVNASVSAADRKLGERCTMSARWSLEGFKAVVTGSTKGLGRACAAEMLALGAEVITARKPEEVEATCCELSTALRGAKVKGLAADVSTKEGRQALVDFVGKLWGGVLDGLVNNASEEEYHNMMRTNVDSCWFLCKMFKPMLGRSSRGSVVNISSAAGVRSTGTGSVYAMTKAAMAHLACSLACEWGPLGIRVNCVCPWMARTPLLEEAVKNNPQQLEDVKRATCPNCAGLRGFLGVMRTSVGDGVCADAKRRVARVFQSCGPWRSSEGLGGLNVVS